MLHHSLQVFHIFVARPMVYLQVLTRRISFDWPCLDVSVLRMFSLQSFLSPMLSWFEKAFVKEWLFCLSGLFSCLRTRDWFVIAWLEVHWKNFFVLVFVFVTGMEMKSSVFLLALQIIDCNRITSQKPGNLKVSVLDYALHISDFSSQIINFFNQLRILSVFLEQFNFLLLLIFLIRINSFMKTRLQMLPNSIQFSQRTFTSGIWWSWSI